MRAFAAVGIIAAASAAQTEAAASSSSLFDHYYGYGYPEFDHKEELTHSPAREHHKKAHTYRTNNIDIFAHSDSESDHHGHHDSHHDSHSSHSSHSDHSDDDHHGHKKHHMTFLTGYGPEGDHCHEGDWCGDEELSSDYTDSDY